MCLNEASSQVEGAQGVAIHRALEVYRRIYERNLAKLEKLFDSYCQTPRLHTSPRGKEGSRLRPETSFPKTLFQLRIFDPQGFFAAGGKALASVQKPCLSKILVFITFDLLMPHFDVTDIKPLACEPLGSLTVRSIDATLRRGRHQASRLRTTGQPYRLEFSSRKQADGNKVLRWGRSRISISFWVPGCR